MLSGGRGLKTSITQDPVLIRVGHDFCVLTITAANRPNVQGFRVTESIIQCVVSILKLPVTYDML